MASQVSVFLPAAYLLPLNAEKCQFDVSSVAFGESSSVFGPYKEVVENSHSKFHRKNIYCRVLVSFSGICLSPQHGAVSCTCPHLWSSGFPKIELLVVSTKSKINFSELVVRLLLINVLTHNRPNHGVHFWAKELKYTV